MPRGSRLDAPGALHHVMVRGIEGRSIFADDVDRQDWVDRLATIGPETGLSVLAWALLPNHFHLLVRTGARPLATTMRRLLTGYAGSFNRRHKRAGHLFQNRYKSILVEEEPYLLELVRYVHLNPLRAKIVSTLDMLDEYPWTGHSALMGRVPRPWQAVGEVLGCFGPRSRHARHRYREYVAEGVAQGRRKELQGGGLRRSAGGWEIVGDLHRGREHGMADERVLGSGAFVEEVHRTVAAQSTARAPCGGVGTVADASPAVCGTLGDHRRGIVRGEQAACRVAGPRGGRRACDSATWPSDGRDGSHVGSIVSRHLQCAVALRCDPRSPGIERRRPDATGPSDGEK